jgi:hypothetical protein
MLLLEPGKTRAVVIPPEATILKALSDGLNASRALTKGTAG